MKNHLRRLLLVILSVCLLFQQAALPVSLDAAQFTAVVMDSNEKAGTVEDTGEKGSRKSKKTEQEKMESSVGVRGMQPVRRAVREETDAAGSRSDGERDSSGDHAGDAQGTGETAQDDTEQEEDSEEDAEEDSAKKEQAGRLRAAPGVDNSFNMPEATYETFILQGADGQGQRIGDSGQVTMLPSQEAIQNDITAKHNDYVSFTPHWGEDTTAELSTQSGSRDVRFYVDDPDKAAHVGGIGEADMTPNIVGGRVFKLEDSMKNTLSCTYQNVGRYYDRSSGKSYAIDMKAVVVDFTKKPDETVDVQNAVADEVFEEGEEGPLFCFVQKKSIGVLTAFCDAVTVQYSFYIHGTQTPIQLKGFARFGDVDAQQGIEFSPEADYFYATETADQYLGYSKGVYGAGNRAYIYSLSSAAYKENEGNTFYTLFSGSGMTLRYTFAKCSRQDDGGEKNGSDLKQYKVPFDDSEVKHYTSSASRGYMHFDARQPYLPQPEIQKSVFNGKDIQAEMQTPHTAVSNVLEDADDVFTYKVRTVCPYGDASEHHYSSWIIKDQLSPYLDVEQAAVYDGTGVQSEDFEIQTQEQEDGSTLVTATAKNPSEQSFYEKSWYDLYITVRIKTQEELDSRGLDFASQYVSSGDNAGRYVLSNQAVLSTGTDYTSNEVQTVIPQQITIRKVNEDGEPVQGIMFGIFTSADADVQKEKPLMEAVTGADGTAHFQSTSFYELAGKTGPYYVREISRGVWENVYLLDKDWNYAFSSDMGNPVIYGEKADREANTLEDVAKMLRKYSVQIRKKNKETSHFLKGAVFGLYQWSEAGDSYVKVCDLEEYTDKEGEVCYRNPEDILATEDNRGRFMVKEEQAPHGCYNAQESWTFVTTDEYAEKEAELKFFCTGEDGSERSQSGELIYENKLQKGILHLIKTNETGAGVAGAVFEIRAAEDIYAPWQYMEDGSPDSEQEPLVPQGTVCGSLTTDEEGNAQSEPLCIGKYQIVEVGGAPDHVQSDKVYEVAFTYPEKDDVEIVEETVQVGNVLMRPAFSVAKLAERTRNPEGEEVAFDLSAGRYSEEKIPGSYHAGETIRYRITVTNTGNTDLYHVRLYDRMDEQNAVGQKLSDYVDKERASFVLPSSGSYETDKGEKITVSLLEDGKTALLGRLPDGDSVTLYFEAPVLENAANAYDLVNQVSVTASYDNNEESPGQHLIPVNTEDLVDAEGDPLTEDEDKIHIPGEPDTTVVKMADRTTGGMVTDGEFTGVKVPGLYYEGDTVRFDIHVKNTGTANLKNIVVTDIMSEELKQVTDAGSAAFRLKEESEKEPSGETETVTVGRIRTERGEEISARQMDANRVILCENVDDATGAGSLKPGDTVVLHFYAKVKMDAANFYDLKNTAVVNASYFTGETDAPAPEKTDEDVIELPGIPEARIAKIADRTTGAVLVDGRYQNEKITGSYDRGSEMVFTITVTNSGSADLYDLKVRDVMEERLLSALEKESIRFKDGKYTTAAGNTVKATAQEGTVLLLDALKAGDSVTLQLQATVSEEAGELSELENKVYVTGHYRRGDETYQQSLKESAEAVGHSYTLEYHANNGTTQKTPDSETPAPKGEAVQINGNPFTREGYDFLGWNTAADGSGEEFAPGASYQMPAQDVHLYARWGKEGSVLKKDYTYALTYHSNNPRSQSYSDSETRCREGTAILLDENLFRYDGYQFLGWSLTPEEKEELLQPGETWRMPNRDIHLYAQWEKEEQVTLTYHSNIPGQEQKKTDFQTPCAKGTKISVKQCGFEREGYRFSGWASGKNSTEAEYSPQDILTLDRDISLYAVWEKEKDGEKQMRYSLTYHGNNETDDAFVDNGTPCPSGSTVILAQNLFTYDGYEFVGWNTKADGTGKTWDVNASYTMPDRNVHLYAQWIRQNEVTVTYLSNYPDKADSVKDERRIDCETPCPEKTTVRIDGCAFQCDGYRFLGWSLTPDGSAELILPDTQYTADADTKLYAIWSDDSEEYTLLYSSNTETPVREAAPDSPAPAGTPQTLIANPFSSKDAVFVGWSTGKDTSPESENLLQPGQKFTQPAEDTVLYAVWKKTKSQTLYYDANGGENRSDTSGGGQRILDEETPGIAGTKIRINTSPFQREGYRFLGWSTEIVEPLAAVETAETQTSTEKEKPVTWAQAVQQTEIIYPGCTYALPENDTVLYAVWEEIPKNSFDGDSMTYGEEELAESPYTPIPVTELMKDQDHVNIPGVPDPPVEKKTDKNDTVPTREKDEEQKPTTPSEERKGDIPQTGDDTPIYPWLLTGICSLAAAGIVILHMRKTKKK